MLSDVIMFTVCFIFTAICVIRCMTALGVLCMDVHNLPAPLN